MRRKPLWLYAWLAGPGLVLPVVLYLLLVEAYPFIWAVIVSFTNATVGTAERFVGLGNYVHLAGDPLFWKSVENTAIFTGSATVAKLVFGMAMALVLNRRLIARNLFRALLFVPWTIPTLVSVFTWQWMFSDIGGVLNFLLMKGHLIRVPVGWLSTPALAMTSVVLVNVWRGTPFFGISLLSGLQVIPNELYEAAAVDGANALHRFLSITLPSLRDILLLVTLVSTIWTLNDFQIVWLLTRGGPSNGTQIISTYSYTLGFLNLQLAQAIAVSVAIFPALVLLVLGVTRIVLQPSTE
jgi:multiple sugar transport system permease protein